MNPAASPLRRVKRTTWSAPCARATSAVPSVDPSSMISTSTTSMPGIARGMAASVAGSVSALVQARDLDDELHATRRTVAHALRSPRLPARTRRSTAPRQAEYKRNWARLSRTLGLAPGRACAAPPRAAREPGGGGRRGRQRGGDAPEAVVHGDGLREVRHPARDLEQRALAAARRRRGRTWRGRSRPARGRPRRVEMEAEAGLEGGGADVLQRGSSRGGCSRAIGPFTTSSRSARGDVGRGPPACAASSTAVEARRRAPSSGSAAARTAASSRVKAVMPAPASRSRVAAASAGAAARCRWYPPRRAHCCGLVGGEAEGRGQRARVRVLAGAPPPARAPARGAGARPAARACSVAAARPPVTGSAGRHESAPQYTRLPPRHVATAARPARDA